MGTNAALEQSTSNVIDPDTICATTTRAERVGTYGTIQHHDPVTGNIVLNPKPSNDINDPLNWYGLNQPFNHSDS